MVEIDPTGLIITLAAGIGIPILLFSMKGFRNTAEGTLTGTIKLEGLKTNVIETKEEMEKGFNRIEAMLNKRDEKMDKMFADTNRRVDEIYQKVMLSEYRIKSLERTRVARAKGEYSTTKQDIDRYTSEEENGG